MYPGGNAVNVAVHARRLGCESAYIGCLGSDAAGELIYNALVEEGVDVSRVRRMAGENAYCDIRLVDGERVFGDFSGGMVDQLTLEDSDMAYLSRFDLVHTSVYSFVDEKLPEIKERAQFLSYDFSNEWDQQLLEKILPLVDFALISNPTEDICSHLPLLRWAAGLGPKMVMATSGEQGSAVYDGKELFVQPVAATDNVVDTLGAGDAFAACFLTRYLEKETIEKALQEAAKYAANECTQHGAFGHGRRYII